MNDPATPTIEQERWLELLGEVRTDVEAMAVCSAVRNANDTAVENDYERGTPQWFGIAAQTYDFALETLCSERARHLSCPYGTYHCLKFGDSYFHADCAFVKLRDDRGVRR